MTPTIPHRASGLSPFDPSLAVFAGQYEALAGCFRAMPFRPALPMNRAVLHRLGLSVGIAIALAGCRREPSPIETGDDTVMVFCHNDATGRIEPMGEARVHDAIDAIKNPPPEGYSACGYTRPV